MATFWFGLCAGELWFSWWDIPHYLFQSSGVEHTIIVQLRLPRSLLAIGVGGALSLSGTLLQGIFRNPLVEPYTLGISGGAALGVSFAILLGATGLFGLFSLSVWGFLGGLGAIILVYSLSMGGGRNRLSNNLLLIGVMVSFICSSFMMLLLSIFTAEDLQRVFFWTMGSLDESNMGLAYAMLWVALLGLFLSYLFVRPLNALRLGAEKAKHLGIHISRLYHIIFILASLLTGISVSITGIIGFVGLLVPHFMRLLIGTDFRILLISSFLGGGFFLLICDLLARTLILPSELPIGVLTGIIGGTTFIVMLLRKAPKT